MGYDRGRKGQHHSARRERPGRGRWWCTAATHLQLEESREEVLAKLAEGLVLHLEAREDVLRGGFNGIRERGGELLLRSCVVGALFAAPSAPHPAAAPSNLTTRGVALPAQENLTYGYFGTSHTGTLATSQFARRAGLFARFEEQFSQMTHAIKNQHQSAERCRGVVYPSGRPSGDARPRRIKADGDHRRAHNTRDRPHPVASRASEARTICLSRPSPWRCPRARSCATLASAPSDDRPPLVGSPPDPPR